MSCSASAREVNQMPDTALREPVLGCLNDMQKKFLGKTKALIQVGSQENLRKAHKRFMSHGQFMSPMSSESILKKACDWLWHPCHLSWTYCHFFLPWMVRRPCITLYQADHFSKYLSCKRWNLTPLTREFAGAKHDCCQASWQPQLQQAASRADQTVCWNQTMHSQPLGIEFDQSEWARNCLIGMAIKKVLSTWMFFKMSSQSWFETATFALHPAAI